MAPQMAGVVNKIIYRMAADVGDHMKSYSVWIQDCLKFWGV